MKRAAAWTAAVLAAVFLPLRAAAADGTASTVQTRTGEWTDARSAIPGEELRCRAELTVRPAESWTVRGMLGTGLEFRSLTAVLADGESVNASFYTLLSGTQCPESAFEIHLAERFSPYESVRLTVEWMARLSDGCAAGEDGNRFFLQAQSADGTASESGAAAVYTYGFTVFRGVRFAETGIPDHPLPSACFRLYYDAALAEPVMFRERGGAFLACTARNCAHTRHGCLLRTGESGTVRIEGLAAGTYYLCETRPPVGYECDAETLRVTVSETGVVEAEEKPVSGHTILLLEKGTQPPGGDDPLAFYRRGCGVMAALFAAVFLRKR